MCVSNQDKVSYNCWNLNRVSDNFVEIWIRWSSSLRSACNSCFERTIWIKNPLNWTSKLKWKINIWIEAWQTTTNIIRGKDDLTGGSIQRHPRRRRLHRLLIPRGLARGCPQILPARQQPAINLNLDVGCLNLATKSYVNERTYTWDVGCTERICRNTWMEINLPENNMPHHKPETTIK